MLNKLHIFIDHNFLVTLYMYIIMQVYVQINIKEGVRASRVNLFMKNVGATILHVIMV